MNEHILTGLVILIALGASAQWLAWRLRIPSILVLLVVGFVAGPVTGVLDPEALLGPVTFPIVSIGAAVILFEGGLTTSWQDIRSVVKPVRRLITVGVFITWVGVTTAANHLFGLNWELAALLGAILVVTGPTVIGPLLRHARPHGQVGPILKFEGILNDPLGAVLAVLVFQVIEAEQVETAVSLVALGVLKAAILASAIGLAAAWFYLYLRRHGWLPESLENAFLLPLALVAYTLANSVQHESGLLAVTLMGIALASQHKVNVEVNVEFTEHARTILISVLFVLLTARMEFADFAELSVDAVVFVVAVILVIRPVAAMVSTYRTGVSWRERLFLASMAPRGIVAAALSSVFALQLVDAGYQRAQVLMPVTFLVIAASVVVYGLCATPLVRVLGLDQKTPNGVLLLGANHVARAIGQALRNLNLRVVVVDSDWSKVMQARAADLEAEHGRLLSEHVLNRIDLDDTGHFIALTSNDDTNTLAVAHFRDVFGLDNVHQLHASEDRGAPHPSYAVELRGTHFAKDKTYDELSSSVHRGAVGKTTALTEVFSFDDYQRQHGDNVVPLFAFSELGGLRVLDGEADLPEPGERVVSLALPEGSASPA